MERKKIREKMEMKIALIIFLSAARLPNQLS
jgi:hypothetical protein